MASEQMIYRECAAPGCDCPAAYESDLCAGHHAAREAEQQLAQAQGEIERWQARDAEWAESQAKAVTGYAQARQERDTAVIAVQELGGRIDYLQAENAQARALLMLARGLIINDSKPAAVSMWVSKHDAFLAEHPPA